MMRFNFSKRVPLILLSAVCCVFCSSEMRADAVVFNNLGNATVDGDPVGTFGPLSDSFLTASYGSTLNSVTVLLSGSSDAGSIAVQLLANANDAPGSVVSTLGTVSDTALGNTPKAFTLTPGSDLSLEPAVRYWVNLVSNGSSAAWAWAYNTAETEGVSGEFLSNVNGIFSDDSDAPYQMEVLTSSPEPSFLLPSGLLLVAVPVFLRRRKARSAGEAHS